MLKQSSPFFVQVGLFTYTIQSADFSNLAVQPVGQYQKSMEKGKIYTQDSEILVVLFNFYLFFIEDQLGAAKAKLVELQEAAKLAELKAYEARKEVEAAEFNIEFIKRKGHVEEIFWRFPHLGEKIFEQLDSESLGEFI